MRRNLESMQRAGGERTRAKFAGKTVLIWSGEHRAWWRAAAEPLVRGSRACPT